MSKKSKKVSKKIENEEVSKLPEKTKASVPKTEEVNDTVEPIQQQETPNVSDADKKPKRKKIPLL